MMNLDVNIMNEGWFTEVKYRSYQLTLKAEPTETKDQSSTKEVEGCGWLT